MDEYAFRAKVVEDLTELKVQIARIEEQLKPIQESRRDSRKAMFSAVIACLSLLLDLLLRR